MKLVKPYWHLEIKTADGGWVPFATVRGDTEDEAWENAHYNYGGWIKGRECRIVPEAPTNEHGGYV